MSEPTFRFTAGIPRSVQVAGRRLAREEFFEWLWQEFGGRKGLIGVHEGTLLSQQAADQGFETDSWTVDSGEAPRERDWISSQNIASAEIYFSSRKQAEAAKKSLALIAGLTLGAVQEQKPQDWDAEWKASFQGAEIPPFWKIVPPWEKESPPPQGSTGASKRLLRINPGAGFGTGTHETTQLCLQAIGELPAVTGARALDFGSGSGILSIGAAILGYEVDAVEIDPLAIDNATENARLNEMEARIHFSRELPEAPHRYPLVVANILKPVLLEFARTLTERLDPRGTLVLSGLIDQDVAPVGEAFSKLLSGKRPEIRERGEWRALVWRLT